jgi:phasin family protein
MAAKAKKKKAAPKKVATTVLTSQPAKTTAKSTVTVFRSLPKPDFFKMEIDMLKGNKQFEKITQDAATIGQDQMDAVMKSTQVFQKGMEEIIKLATQIAQDAGEKQAAATKTLMSCKTLNEFTDAQSKLAQSSFDNFMSNATRMTELSVKVCTDCFAPINDQVGKAVKKASDSIAA